MRGKTSFEQAAKLSVKAMNNLECHLNGTGVQRTSTLPGWFERVIALSMQKHGNLKHLEETALVTAKSPRDGVLRADVRNAFQIDVNSFVGAILQ
jgi:hypothetical protein